MRAVTLNRICGTAVFTNSLEALEYYSFFDLNKKTLCARIYNEKATNLYYTLWPITLPLHIVNKYTSNCVENDENASWE